MRLDMPPAAITSSHLLNSTTAASFIIGWGILLQGSSANIAIPKKTLVRRPNCQELHTRLPAGAHGRKIRYRRKSRFKQLPGTRPADMGHRSRVRRGIVGWLLIAAQLSDPQVMGRCNCYVAPCPTRRPPVILTPGAPLMLIPMH